MKSAIITLSLFFGQLTYAGLDLKPGLYEFTTDMSGLLESAMEKVPEAQREQIKKMMMANPKFSKAQSVKQCQTKEMLQDPEGVFKKQAEKDAKLSNCELKVLENGAKKSKVTFNCKDGSKTEMLINVKSQTAYSVLTTSNYPKEGTKLKTEAKWVQAKCPKEN